jgi:hypothetical protein
MVDAEPRANILKQVKASNEKVRAGLVKQLRSPLGVIPFLGAGISAPLRYRQWGVFLTGVADEQLNAAERAEVEEAVAAEDFLRAAGLLTKSLGEEDFQLAVSDEFSDDRLHDFDLTAGMYGYLPLISAGPVITTNFDRVTEHVFKVADRRFDDIVYGANPDAVIPAIQQNRPVLWKLHGDHRDRRTRVLSDDEYQRHYAELPNLLLIALLNRPALFIGCSLDKDRTTEVLTTIRAQHPGTYHYAFVQIPKTDEMFEERVKALRGMGVRPIWYPEGEHQEIEKYLSDLVHELSSVPLAKAKIEKPEKEPQFTAEQASWHLSSEIGELGMMLDIGGRHLLEYPAEAPPYTPILDKIQRGQMTFFLGAAVTMGKLPLGNEFYSDLMAQFDRDAVGSDPAGKYGDMEASKITQHFADKYGRDALYSRVAHQLAAKKPEPSVIHWFIATLRDRLRAKGFKSAPLWILTTNYDDWMEYSLRMVGQPFHLFTYRVNDPHGGSFIYQKPDGTVRLIDRPSHFRRLPEDHTVLIKLHGGLHRDINLPTSYVFTHRDFVELGGKMPGAIPQVILDRLAERSLLFLGSGLNDDSIEAVVREMHRAEPRKLSWAIQYRPRPEKRLYWGELGVQIIDIPQERFMLELNHRLETMTAVP